jgi:hypothetical protein
MFASIRRFHPQAQLTFVTNKPLSSFWLTIFNDIGCANRVLPFEFNPPEGFTNSFQGALFRLDLLANLQGDKLNIVLDPDIVCVAQLPYDFSERAGDKIGVLDLYFSPDQNINGLTLHEQREFQVKHSHPSPHLRHFGGELYVIPKSKIKWLKSELHQIWALNLNAFSSDQPYLITEEQILNFAIGKANTFDLSTFGARIWTTARYRLVPLGFRDLTFWHLPAEKGLGFSKMYDFVAEPNSWFFEATPDNFRDKVAKIMSIAGWEVLLRGKRLLKRLRMSATRAFVATRQKNKGR